MDNKRKKLLFDISTSIDNINKYIGNSRTFDYYDSNPMLQDAVERNLEIIGEAVNKLVKIEPGINISNYRRIIDTRNKIIHGYDEIDNIQVWGIIIKHLPILKEEIIHYLDE